MRLEHHTQRARPRHEQELVLTRFNASSHACFISVTLALFTLTSSLSTSALTVLNNPTTLLLGVLWPLPFVSGGSEVEPLVGFLPRVAIVFIASCKIQMNESGYRWDVVKCRLIQWEMGERGK